MKMGNDNGKDNGIVGGIVLIAIGVIALMVTFFDIEIIWSELAKLWPVFIIFFGISLLPLSKMLKSTLMIVMILISCLLYYNGVKDDDVSEATRYENAGDENVNIQDFSEAFDDNIATAEVEINYGAGTLRLNSPVADLVEAHNMSNCIVQDFAVRYKDSHADIVFDVEDNISVDGGNAGSNDFNIALNENPIYDFEINFGASEMNFDFSEYKVSNIEINGGACDIDVRLGELHDVTEMTINTGVADVRIGIPTESGCSVDCESVMSGKDFDGFVKKSSNVYETANYSYAKKKINIYFTGAISDLKIYRY